MRWNCCRLFVLPAWSRNAPGKGPVICLLAMKKPDQAETSRQEQSSRQAAPADAQAFWTPPYTAIAAPPPTDGPDIPPQDIPTRYAGARVGMRSVLLVLTETGGRAKRVLEVLDVQGGNVRIRETAVSQYGDYFCDMDRERSRPAGDADSQAGRKSQEQKEKFVRTELVTIKGKKLLCDVHEFVSGGYTYRTWLCPDILGGVVRHADNAGGTWRTRLKLVDFDE
jgi:hypothetical protein